MKRLQRWCAVFVACAGFGFASAQLQDVKINEVLFNAPGGDNGFEYFELISCTPGISLNGLTLLVIEGDGAAAGVVDQALSLAGEATGPNGLFLWRDATIPLVPPPAPGTQIKIQDFVPDIENGGQTYMLVRGFTAAVGTDLDTDNDGVLDATPWASVLDAVGYSDAPPTPPALLYANQVGGLNFPQVGFVPHWIGRNNCCAWLAAQVTGTNPGPYTFDPLRTINAAGLPVPAGAGFVATPGSDNPYPCFSPRIFGIDPLEGGPDDFVQIVGTGFGNNPDNLCVVIANGPRLIPLTVVEANDQSIRARINSVPEDAEPGRIMVMTGQSSRGTFEPILSGIIPEDPRGTWIWRGTDPGVGASEQLFRPIHRPPPPPITWYEGIVNPGDNGTICIFLREPWMPNSYVRVISRLHGFQGCCRFDFWDQEIGCVRFRNGGSALDCARKLCDTIVCGFRSGGVEVRCRVIPQSDGSVKIEISFPPGTTLESGALSVCVQMPRKVPLPIPNWFVTGFFSAIPDPTPTGGVLVSNIGSSGQDGVTIDMGPNPDGLQVGFDPIRLPPVPGASISLQGWGGVGSESHHPLGRVHGEWTQDSFFDVFVDFDPIRSPRAMVEVVLDGQVVETQVIPTGRIAAIRDPNGVDIGGCGKITTRPPFPLPCYIIRFPRPYDIVLPGGLLPASGDEMRILAIDAAEPIDNVQQFDIAVGGAPEGQFIIREARPLDTGGDCPDCAADYNQDGGIDGADVESFFNEWEGGTGCADVNDDGGIDGADVESFFRVWENGGCG